MTIRALALLLLLLGACLAPPAPAQDLAARVDELARPLLDNGLSVGLAVGTLKEGRSWTRGYGRVSADGDAMPDAGTVYEIGSITKVFTGILLALAVERGEVALEDPVRMHLPAEVAFPLFEERPIRLVDLSDHTSGLPRMPPDFAPADPTNPFADYDEAKLWTSLGRITLTRGPGDRYEYSNLAQGLLGHILCRRAGRDYEGLLRREITDPLGMQDTRVRFTEAMRARLAPGYDAAGRPRANWDLDALAGAGAIRSTVGDMLTFAAANLDPPDSELGRAMRAAQQIRHDPEAGMAVGLGWHFDRSKETLWHNGGTGGYHAFLGIRPKEKLAVVILANTTSGLVDSLGNQVLRLLRGEEVEPPEIRPAVEVDRKILARYVGEYEFAPGIVLTITLEEKGLMAQLTGQDAYQMYPASETRFFWRVAPAEATFEVDEDGRVMAIILHQNGIDQRATRKDDQGG